MSLIWTRAQEDWSQDAQLFPAGVAVRHLPCISFKPLPLPSDARGQFSSFVAQNETLASVFTSARAIAYAWQVPPLQSLLRRCERHYAVGSETCRSLEAFGLQAFWPPQVSDGQSLARYLLQAERADTAFCVLGASKRAYPLAEDLVGKGFRVISWDIYETYTGVFKAGGKPLDAGEKAAWLEQLNKKSIVCFASPSAVEGFCLGFQLDSHKRSKPSLHQLAVAAIGNTTAKACRPYFECVRLAASPSLKQLIELAVNFW